MLDAGVGLISTLADAGASDRLRVVGPRNTKHCIAAMRPFVHRSGYALAVDELDGDSNACYADGKLSIRVLELAAAPPAAPPHAPKKRKGSGAVAVENLDVAAPGPHHFLLRMFRDPAPYGTAVPEEALLGREHYLHAEQERMTHTARLPPATPTRTALGYIVEGPATPGKFMAAVAKQLGVPHGPLNGRLQRGEPVSLPDGSTVTPDMCIGPATPGPVFVYLDVPSAAHAADLAAKQAELHLPNLKLVIHHAPPAVYASAVYRALQWPAGVQHIHLADSMQPAYAAPATILDTLGAGLGRAVYPAPYHRLAAGETRALTKYHWIASGARPAPALDTAEAAGLDRPAAGSASAPPATALLTTVLGTGAALPGKYRNVSATLLAYADGSAILLDCGESTLGQILRAHGTRYEAVVRSITTVFVSHLHADHHAGVMGLLRKRQALAIPELITIVGPQRYALWLEEYGECVDIGPYRFVACEDLLEAGAPIRAVPVLHCPRSYGCVIDRGGLRVVFSGDTRPCDALISAGSGADLLIHEATMGDDLQHEAVAKRHCTITEAITVGRQMEAKHILLTHFSQRYSKTAPPVPEPLAGNVSVAFDLMQVPIEEMGAIEGYAYNCRLRQLLPEEPCAEE